MVNYVFPESFTQSTMTVDYVRVWLTPAPPPGEGMRPGGGQQ